MSAQDLLNKLLRAIDEKDKNIEFIEDQVSDKIVEISKLPNFSDLPLETVKRILSHTGPIDTPIACHILATISQKYGGDTCILLKCLRLHDSSIDSMCQCVASIKGSAFCDKMKTTGTKDLMRIRKHITHLEKEVVSFRTEINRLRAILGHYQDIKISMLKPELDAERDDKGIFDCIRKGQLGRVKRILMDDPALISIEGTDDITPLEYASFYGQDEIARLLIDNGANIESRDQQDNTPLIVAAENGELDTVRLLVSKKADLEAKNIVGRTPLMCAVASQHEDVVSFLLDQKADFEVRDKTGSNPLLLAAQWGNLPIAQELVAMGAEIDTKDAMDTTPLMRAARGGFLSVVKFLIDIGANVNLVNKDGKSAYDFAYSIEVRQLIHKAKRATKA